MNSREEKKYIRLKSIANSRYEYYYNRVLVLREMYCKCATGKKELMLLMNYLKQKMQLFEGMEMFFSKLLNGGF